MFLGAVFALYRTTVYFAKEEYGKDVPLLTLPKGVNFIGTEAGLRGERSDQKSGLQNCY